MLTTESLSRFQSAIAEAGANGWLLYDFRNTNPIAHEILQLQGMVSRRVFAWIPAKGTPVAIEHAIEPGTWAQWPTGWKRRVYSSWRTLESELGKLVKGKKVLMEYSPGDAVPVVDRIPAGVLDLVKKSGAKVITSADLVSQFFAVWSESGLASHKRAAEHIARIAREAFKRAGAAVKGGTPMAEHELMAWIAAEFGKCGLSTDHGPNVSASENAANPHYEPTAAAPRVLRAGDSLLIDLWATEPGGIYADQTWMGSLGAPSAKLQKVWTMVRDARDASLKLLRDRIETGKAVRGGEADDAARAVIRKGGYVKEFTHRTGHSIDARALHGSGPNLDNLETRDGRGLIPGVGFSVEPGVYIPGQFGVRSEVNCHVGDRTLLVTPREIQKDLFIV